MLPTGLPHQVPLDHLTDAGRLPAGKGNDLNRQGRDFDTRGVRTVALSLAIALVAIGLVAAPGASAREAGKGPAAELASQLLPIRGGNDAAIDAARQVDLTISEGRAGARPGLRLRHAPTLRSGGCATPECRVKATADEPVPVVEGWVRATDLASVASLGVTTAVMPVLAGGSDAGLVTSEGVAAHRIPQALSFWRLHRETAWTSASFRLDRPRRRRHRCIAGHR